MIYEYRDVGAPIRQGDIFVGLPRVEVSLADIAVLEKDDSATKRQWREIALQGETVTAILPVRPVTAIVATQDCDATHEQDITLCEVRPFSDVYPPAANASTPKAWKNIITQHARANQKWFYLPPDGRIGFNDKMAVDFMVTLRVPRAELEALRDLRRGRLNPLADEHFRERIAEFFRRYPYDEWYPLDPDELKTYLDKYPDAEPYPWQQVSPAR